VPRIACPLSGGLSGTSPGTRADPQRRFPTRALCLLEEDAGGAYATFARAGAAVADSCSITALRGGFGLWVTPHGHCDTLGAFRISR
jgi:hypothetical protein